MGAGLSHHMRSNKRMEIVISDCRCNREVESKDLAVVDLLVFESLKYPDYRLFREMSQMDSISPSAVMRHPTISPA